MGRNRKSNPVGDITNGSSTRRQVLRFVIFFLITLLMLALSVAFVSSWLNNAGRSLYFFTTNAVAGLAEVLGTDVLCVGNKITYTGFTLEVVGECTGLTEIVIFIAAVVAFPTDVRRKLLGVVLGIVVILAANVMRMVSLLWIGASSLYWFSIFHFYTYQASMLLLVIGTWLLWLNYAVLRNKQRDTVVSR